MWEDWAIPTCLSRLNLSINLYISSCQLFRQCVIEELNPVINHQVADLDFASLSFTNKNRMAHCREKIINLCSWDSLKPWASCQIRKIVGAHAPGMPGTFSPSPQVSDLDMHHGTCVTHVPWCMPGSLTSGFLWNRWRGKTFPAFPAHAQPAILRIW